MEEIIAAEQADGRRILAENDSAIAFIPYFARYAYETFVVPRQPHASLADLSPTELERPGRGAAGGADPFRQPLVDVVPVRDGLAPGADGRAERTRASTSTSSSTRRSRKPNLLKYLAGPEIGGGSFLSDTSPEEKAAELRAVSPVHYKQARGGSQPNADRSHGYDPSSAERIESFLGGSDDAGSPRVPLFEPGAPIVVARAPGRLDVMGGIADYSGLAGPPMADPRGHPGGRRRP